MLGRVHSQNNLRRAIIQYSTLQKETIKTCFPPFKKRTSPIQIQQQQKQQQHIIQQISVPLHT